MREQSCHEVRTLYYPLPFLLHLSLYLPQLSVCAPYQCFIHMAFLSFCVIVNPADRYSGTFRMSVHFSRVHGVTFQEKVSLRSEKWSVCSTTLTFTKSVVSIRDDWYMSSALSTNHTWTILGSNPSSFDERQFSVRRLW
jgi:hypothetical protein